MKVSEAKRASEARTEADTPRKWTGYYRQGSTEHQMNIELLTVDFLSNIIHGEGSDDVGEFVFDGKIASNSFEFVKQYKDKHAIYYEGEFEGQETMTGHWGFKKGAKED